METRSIVMARSRTDRRTRFKRSPPCRRGRVGASLGPAAAIVSSAAGPGRRASPMPMLPALFAAPDRTLWLFYPTILDHRWEGALLKFAVARDATGDGPPSWSREGVLHVTPTGFDRAMAAAMADLEASGAALPRSAREALS